VELESHLPVGLLELVLVGFGDDTQHLVEVLAGGLDGQAGRVRLRLGAFLFFQTKNNEALEHLVGIHNSFFLS